ncbi:ROK family protein [Alloacidobacterium sp.]|uniref:ROK family protein n=1 Tax=Alloacidobacterium sp. TaxID=2951999 RepID=UPI002D3B3B3A|nr:ROK family protein [Alloacidobacterium sp.]HYK37212.1 ROK family protein [Alloacidobacterium sp.]
MNDFSIGIDLGGTNLRIAAFTSEWYRLEAITIPTRVQDGPGAVLDDMCAAVRKLVAGCGGGGNLAGMGLGSPGPLELPSGRLLTPPNLPGFERLELKTELEKRLQVPVIVECDANAAALAECHAGVGRKSNCLSLCMLTLGTGVGSGIILNGRVWHGFAGMAGEAGHVPVYHGGLLCGCGTHGCLEQYASATAIARAGQELTHTRTHNGFGTITARSIAEAALAGDTESQRIYDCVGEALGIGLASLVSMLNVPLYVIGGGVAAAWDLFAPAMFAEMDRGSYIYRLTRPANPAEYEAGKTNVFPAELGPDSGLLGAAMLPFFQSLSS